MMRHQLPRIALIACALTVLAGTGLATSLVEMSVQQLTQASNVIVRGHAVNQVTQWNENHSEIETLTTFAVDQIVKGQPASAVVVRQMGGTIGHLRIYVPGTVRFLPGVGYLLFLEPSRAVPTHYLVVGMMQGAYRIFRDAKTGEERVINPRGKYFFSARRAPSQAQSQPQTVPLRQFKQQVAGDMSAPIVIPAGTAMALKVESARFDGVGRVTLQARTLTDLFPNPRVVIPAQSVVTGYGEQVASGWVVRWNILEISGTPVKIRTGPEKSFGRPMKGERFMAIVK